MIMLRYPVNYVGVTSAFRTKERPTHNGLDLGWNYSYGGPNTDILACYDGKVTSVLDGKVNDTSKNTVGNYITVDHENGYVTKSIHLLKGSLKVKVGDKVKMGQPIAKMNNSGYSFGSHIHIFVYLNGVIVDPIKHLYLYPDQVVNATTDKQYNILRYDEGKLTLTKSTDELAKEVIKGLWGNGQPRKDRLTSAGYDYSVIQNRVNEILKGTSTEKTYVVKKGDNLSKIASIYKTTWRKIYEDNKKIIGSNPNLIKVGQKLVIK